MYAKRTWVKVSAPRSTASALVELTACLAATYGCRVPVLGSGGIRRGGFRPYHRFGPLVAALEDVAIRTRALTMNPAVTVRDPVLPDHYWMNPFG